MDLFNLIGSVFQASPALPVDPAISNNHKPGSRGNPDLEDDSSGRIVPRICRSRVCKTDIGAPSGFKHRAHVGFNAHDGWDSCFLSDYASNSDLQLIFTKAGIREEHLTDRRTSIKIFEIIERSGRMQAIREEASEIEPSKGQSAPPLRELLSYEVEQPVRGGRARPTRVPFASKVANPPIVPLLPPLKLFSMSSAHPSRAPPLSPSSKKRVVLNGAPLPNFVNRSAPNSDLVPQAPALPPSFMNRAALNSDLPPFMNNTALNSIPPAAPLPYSSVYNAALNSIPPAPPLPSSFVNNTALNSIPPVPPLPSSFMNNAALNSASIPPAPPLPKSFVTNAALNSASIPPASLLPPFVINSALNSASIPPAPPLPNSFVTNAALNSASIPPAPLLPNSFVTNAALNSASIPPASLLPPFVINSVLNSASIPPAPPLPNSFVTNAALNSASIPPSPPLPPFMINSALNPASIPPAPPLPNFSVKNAALNSAYIPPAPPIPPLVKNAALNSAYIPPAPPLPLSFVNNAVLNFALISPAPPLPPFMNNAALTSAPVAPALPLPYTCMGFVAEDKVLEPSAPLAEDYAVAASVPPAPPMPHFQCAFVINCAEAGWIPEPGAQAVQPVLNIATSLLNGPTSQTHAPTSCDLSRSQIAPTLQLPATINSTDSAARDLLPFCNLSISPSVFPACAPFIDPLHTGTTNNLGAPVILRQSRNNTTIRNKPNGSGILQTDQNGKQLASMKPSNLMEQIRKGVELKSTKDGQAKEAAVSAPLADENEDLVKALMEVIRKRDRAIRLPSEFSSEEEWED